jgi:NAD-dependent dihydropyrimidine dehydrogenase PreA subunit
MVFSKGLTQVMAFDRRVQQTRAMNPYVITEPCIGVKDKACVQVCPVDCIYEGDDQLFIHPDECIWCGACVVACPVDAIFQVQDVPAEWTGFIQKARDHFGI